MLASSQVQNQNEPKGRTPAPKTLATNSINKPQNHFYIKVKQLPGLTDELKGRTKTVVTQQTCKSVQIQN